MNRMVFSKKGYAKYISHLDMQRTMQRTLKRAAIPVWYSEGFNPHPYLCFASPLSVGTEGENEIIDFRLAEEMPFEEIKKRINAAFPSGFKAKEIYEATEGVNSIAFAEYILTMPREANQAFREFLKKETIPVIKKTKRSQKEIDLKNEMKDISLNETVDAFVCQLTLPCGNEQNINPQLILKAFEEESGIKAEETRILRTRFFKADMTVFK